MPDSMNNSGIREQLAGDTTVLMATCGRSPFLDMALRRLRHHSPPGLTTIVAHSGEAWEPIATTARAWEARAIRVSEGPVYHDRALDAVRAQAATPYVVTLDSDAFPIADCWLERLVGPLAVDEHAVTVGPRITSPRSVREIPGRLNPFGYRIHVSSQATRTAFMRTRGVTFATQPPAPTDGGLDVSEAITVFALEADLGVVSLPWTAWKVFGTGAVTAGCIYHAFYVTRQAVEAADFLDRQLQDFFGLTLATVQAAQAQLLTLDHDYFVSGASDPLAPFHVSLPHPDVPVPWAHIL